ncbi:hypothetical protein [Legionella rowbothamii]|uniref:hypothetical protein n=1 Tax=Legionella rowbothamii TaxID=96229 RepID=UPI00105429F4|nr:hypothetical protein [Legionella rowbothamii]
MGIESKQDKTAVNAGLSDMSYTTLDEIYPKSTAVKVGSYKAYIGGVSGCWSAFNKDSPPHRIDDSELFAFFRKTDSNNEKDSSWKIHLSIHPNDLNRAWDLIYPFLMEHEVPCFKTTRNTVSQIMYTAMDKADTSSNSLTAAEKEQALRDIIRVFNGMQITIYIPEGKEREYNDLLERIEPILYEAGIRPGVIDKSDRALGIYSSVRNEGVKYTSHDKVSGYKVAALQDPFQAIRIEWNKVKINWGGLDYARHVNKAKGLFFQMLDAEKKYTKGMHTKKEFEQVYDVAMEYFKRWHTLLEKSAPEDLATLAARDQGGFLELKEWVEKGYEFLPSIRKHNAKKVKEAEDVLARSPRVNTLSIKPVPLLKRTKAHFSLNEEIVVKPQVDVVEQADEPKLVKKESFARALQELKAFREDSFNDPLLDMQLNDVLNKPKKSTSKSATRTFWGLFDGLLIGAALGVALSIAFAPWALVICLSLSASGMAIGGVVGHYTTRSSQDTDKQPLIQKKPAETKAVQVIAPHKSSKSLGFFKEDVVDEGDDEYQIVAQPTHIHVAK